MTVATSANEPKFGAFDEKCHIVASHWCAVVVGFVPAFRIDFLDNDRYRKINVIGDSAMAKEFVGVRLDPELIARIDVIAKEVGETRSVIIERLLKDALPEMEDFLKGFENPLLREFVDGALTRPAVMKLVATITGEKLEDKDVERIQRQFVRLRGRARKRSIGEDPDSEDGEPAKARGAKPA